GRLVWRGSRTTALAAEDEQVASDVHDLSRVGRLDASHDVVAHALDGAPIAADDGTAEHGPLPGVLATDLRDPDLEPRLDPVLDLPDHGALLLERVGVLDHQGDLGDGDEHPHPAGHATAWRLPRRSRRSRSDRRP